MIDVPNVIGSSYDKAKANLEALGFTTKKANVASAKEAGQVVATDPLGGNKLQKGSLITIQVSDGSKIMRSLKYDLEKDLPQNEYAEIAVKVILNETNGKNTTLREVNCIPGEGVKLTIELDPKGAVDNKKYVTVTIDNNKYESLTFDFKLQTVAVTYINSKYKVKQAQRDPLLEKRDEVAAEIQNYPDYSDYSEMNEKRVKAIVESYVKVEKAADGTEVKTGAVYEAESIDELKVLLDEAKAAIDVVPKLADPTESSTPSEPSPATSSEPEPEPSVDPSSEPVDELESAKQAAIEEINNYARLHFYTDENWAKIEEILDRYTTKINNAATEADVMSLDLEAQSYIRSVPTLDASSETD